MVLNWEMAAASSSFLRFLSSSLYMAVAPSVFIRWSCLFRCWTRAFRVSSLRNAFLCSWIRFCRFLPVSPMYSLLQCVHGILYIHPVYSCLLCLLWTRFLMVFEDWVTIWNVSDRFCWILSATLLVGRIILRLSSVLCLSGLDIILVAFCIDFWIKRAGYLRDLKHCSIWFISSSRYWGAANADCSEEKSDDNTRFDVFVMVG